jgi:spermidine/putrescine-binding protein
MKELNIYNWEEYERAKERTRLQFNKQTNLGETAKDSEGESV